MRILSLYIKSFKKFDPDITIEFKKDINLIIGVNGSGKSSVFEAIALIFTKVKLYCEGNKQYQEPDDFNFKISYSYIDNKIEANSTTFQETSTVIKLIEIESTRESGLQYSMYVDNVLVKDKSTMLYHLPDNVIFYYAGYSDALKNIVFEIENKQAQTLLSIKDNNVVKFQNELKKQIIYIKEEHYPVLFLLNYLKGNQNTLPLSNDKFTVENISLTIKKPVSFSSSKFQELYNLSGFLRTYLDEILRLSYSGTVEEDIETGKPFIPIEFHNSLLDAIHNIGVWPDDYNYNNDGYLFFQIFNLLVEVGILESINVYIKLENAKFNFNIKQLSEGEQQLITVGAINEYLLKGNSLLVLDEPDAFLHPQRQRELIPYLHGLIGIESYKQILLATHSPNLLNTANNEYVNVVSMENGKILKDVPNFYGRSIKSVNYNLMGVPSRPKEIKDKIDTLFEFIEKENIGAASGILKELTELLGSDDPQLIQAKVQLEFLRLDD